MDKTTTEKVFEAIITAVVPRFKELHPRTQQAYRRDYWQAAVAAVERMERICRHCGDDHPKGHTCQCWNDE